MKNTTMNLMFAAAALVAGAGSASAQTLKAEIPFAFRSGSATMPAGTYYLSSSQSTGRSLVQIRNAETLRSFLVNTAYTSTAKAGNPKLVFQCLANRCELANLSPGQGVTYNFHVKTAGEGAQLAVIPLVSTKGE